jgi:hypothetical protein
MKPTLRRTDSVNPKLLFAILVPCLLLGCAHSNNAALRGNGSPTTDLDALESNARNDLAPRKLPNGKLYCMELARTERAQDSCGGDLEDTLLASETDKAVGLSNLRRGIERIRLSLNPCRWYDVSCKRRARELDKRPPTNGN